MTDRAVESEGLIIVDCACYCDDCTRREREFYHLNASCSNCGTKYITKHRKGDPPSPRTECPACGVAWCCTRGGLANVG